MCMKNPYTMLNMIIPRKIAPRTDIDVYLQPLISEIKLLWDIGVKTYDFPAYGNLSGCSVKGCLACRVCNKGTRSQYLPHQKK